VLNTLSSELGIACRSQDPTALKRINQYTHVYHMGQNRSREQHAAASAQQRARALFFFYCFSCTENP
jgi:hypothetical protein